MITSARAYWFSRLPTVDEDVLCSYVYDVAHKYAFEPYDAVILLIVSPRLHVASYVARVVISRGEDSA